jgi:hypothetical protein
MARAAIPGRLTWTLGEVVTMLDETPRVRSIVLDVPSSVLGRTRIETGTERSSRLHHPAAKDADDYERLRRVVAIQRLADQDVIDEEIRAGITRVPDRDGMT